MDNTTNTKDEKYNILLTPSSAYFNYTLVFMMSAIKNCERNINFFIMQSDWTNMQKQTCYEFIKEYTPCTVNIIDVQDKDFEELGSWRKRNNTSYKLLASQYIPQKLNDENIDRIISFDADAFVAKDFGNLYFDDFQEAVATIAVHPTLSFTTFDKYALNHKNGQWPNYYVGGVILLNLQAFRKEKIDLNYYKEKIGNLGYEPLFADEGILNELFRSRIKPFAYYKYNFMLGYYDKYQEPYKLTKEDRITKCNAIYYEDFDEQKFASIVHFAGGPDIIPKPWNTLVDDKGNMFGNFKNQKIIPRLYKYYKEWWDYAELLPQQIFNELKQSAFNSLNTHLTSLNNKLLWCSNAMNFFESICDDYVTNFKLLTYMKTHKNTSISILKAYDAAGKFFSRCLKLFDIKVMFSTQKGRLADLTDEEWENCKKADNIICCCVHGTLPVERDGRKPIMIKDILKDESLLQNGSQLNFENRNNNLSEKIDNLGSKLDMMSIMCQILEQLNDINKKIKE